MLLRVLAFSILVTGFACAADFHVTPGGSGKRDGASWENAFDQGRLGAVVNEVMQPGDRLLLGGGVYQDVELTITAGGVEGRPKIILGVEDGAGLPVFSAAWSVERPSKGRTAIRMAPGVSHLVIRNLRIQGYSFGIQAPAAQEAGARSHLAFEDVDIEQFRYGFYLADCDDLRLTGCDLKRYTKHGFRFDQGCDRVTVQQCTADCSEGDEAWEKKTEALPFGFVVTDSGAPNTAFVFEDCLARNHMMPLQTGRYKNGDGFVVEGNSADVAFVRCRALRNQDGGFDLKVRDVRLTGCVAVGNKRAYRIWTTGVLTNCLAGWSSGSGLWCNGGPVVASRCTFHAARGPAVMTDDRATQPITLRDCIISLPPETKEARATKGQVNLTATVISGPGRSEKDPAYLRPDPQWDGLGDAMDSRAYPNQGYRSNMARRGSRR